MQLDKLRPIHIRVLSMWHEGLTVEEIADRLGKKPLTVRGYIRQIHEIYDVHTTWQAYDLAVKLGNIEKS